VEVKIMKLKEFIEKTYNKDPYNKRPLIVCKDGFSISVQASEAHYSVPRKSVKQYSKMEIGYPSQEEKEIIEYAEEAEELTNTVYPYVPFEVVDSVIEKHGGIDVKKTFIKRNILNTILGC
jgi:hypothetical protein